MAFYHASGPPSASLITTTDVKFSMFLFFGGNILWAALVWIVAATASEKKTTKVTLDPSIRSYVGVQDPQGSCTIYRPLRSGSGKERQNLGLVSLPSRFFPLFFFFRGRWWGDGVEVRLFPFPLVLICSTLLLLLPSREVFW